MTVIFEAVMSRGKRRVKSGVVVIGENFVDELKVAQLAFCGETEGEGMDGVLTVAGEEGAFYYFWGGNGYF